MCVKFSYSCTSDSAGAGAGVANSAENSLLYSLNVRYSDANASVGTDSGAELKVFNPAKMAPAATVPAMAASEAVLLPSPFVSSEDVPCT